MHFGRYLEEFTVGDVYKHWPGRTITESDDILFCMLTRTTIPFTSTPTMRPAPSSGGTWWWGTWWWTSPWA